MKLICEEYGIINQNNDLKIGDDFEKIRRCNLNQLFKIFEESVKIFFDALPETMRNVILFLVIGSVFIVRIVKIFQILSEILVNITQGLKNISEIKEREKLRLKKGSGKSIFRREQSKRHISRKKRLAMKGLVIKKMI